MSPIDTFIQKLSPKARRYVLLIWLVLGVFIGIELFLHTIRHQPYGFAFFLVPGFFHLYFAYCWLTHFRGRSNHYQMRKLNAGLH